MKCVMYLSLRVFPFFSYLHFISKQTFFSRCRALVTKTEKNLRSELAFRFKKSGPKVMSTDSETWEHIGRTSESVGDVAGREKDRYLKSVGLQNTSIMNT